MSQIEMDAVLDGMDLQPENETMADVDDLPNDLCEVAIGCMTEIVSASTEFVELAELVGVTELVEVTELVGVTPELMEASEELPASPEVAEEASISEPIQHDVHSGATATDCDATVISDTAASCNANVAATEAVGSGTTDVTCSLPVAELSSAESPVADLPAIEVEATEDPSTTDEAEKLDVQVDRVPELAAEAIDDVLAKGREEASQNEFRALGLSDAIVQSLDQAGYTTPTPIQAQAIPLLLTGRDVLGQAQTGTGKTAAFALPLLDRINLSNKRPQVLVLVPTRELAIQVAEAFEKYAGKMRGLRVVPIYGGQDYNTQLRPLSQGVHVVVGTPGRVMDHIRRGSLKLEAMQCLVLDEADEMLKMGFADDVEWVLTQAPEKRQIALFSATMPKAIRQIAQRHQTNPSEITIAQKTATADTIHQRALFVTRWQKDSALARILESEPTEGVLVFVKTRATSEPLAEYLAQLGWKTAALSGDVAQNQRERIVEGLRSGRIDVIVATDVAARGLDVQRISHVVNYDLPHDSEAYVHRIGRTGRAGRSGQAILFVHPREQRFLKRLEFDMRTTIHTMELPTNRAINKQRVARFHEKITEALAHADLDVFKAIVEHYQRENDVSLDLIAAALAMMANGGKTLLVKDEFDQPERPAGSKPRNERNDRFDSEERTAKPRSGPRRSVKMDSYRIEVGKKHDVLPGNIVGAIANESGLGRDEIGKIRIFEHFSIVDLAEGVPANVLERLQNVSVAGQKLQISLDQGPRTATVGRKRFRPNQSPQGRPPKRR